MSRALFLSILVLTLPFVTACTTGPWGWYYEPAVYQIHLDLPVGTSLEKVDAYLTEHQIEHSYLRSTNQIKALVRNVRRDGLVQADQTLTFTFNAYGSLTDFAVKNAYTKP